MESIYQNVGKALREARLQQGLTQQTVAEMAGISVAFLSFLELGQRKGSLQTYHDLAKGLGLSLDTLFQDMKGAKKAATRYRDPRFENLSAAELQALFKLVKTIRKPKKD